MPEPSWEPIFAAVSTRGTENYDAVMVPALFAPWAEVLLDLVAPVRGEALLDLACGPGTVARLAAARVGPEGRVVGCDLSPAMLAVARNKPPVEDGAAVEYLEAPADDVPVEDASFDVVTCQHGLQFFGDRIAAVAEMRRVLRRGGRVGIAVWAEIESCPPMAGVAAAIGEVLGEGAADRYRAGPTSLRGEVVAADLGAAGFGAVDHRRLSRPIVMPGGAQGMMGSASVAAIAQAAGAQAGPLAVALRDAIVRHLGPMTVDGVVRSHYTAHLVLGRV